MESVVCILLMVASLELLWCSKVCDWLHQGSKGTVSRVSQRFAEVTKLGSNQAAHLSCEVAALERPQKDLQSAPPCVAVLPVRVL